MSPLVLALLTTSPVSAAEVGVGVYAGALAPVASDGHEPFGLGGVRLRYRWNEDWAVEGDFGIGRGGYNDPRLELLRFVGDPSRSVQLFLAGGVGLYTRAGDPAYPLVDAGLGLDSELFPVLDLRTDARVRFMTGSDPVGALLLEAGLQLHNPRARDADGDGVGDATDRCVDVAEDLDGFEDADGCPDVDNDADGLADTADTCPAEKEDADGFQDGDGCPDVDDDGDGLLDVTDPCPREAEDRDSFEDTDGCPDPDNDRDGILDGVDACPSAPETVNGYQEKDGCPDEIPAAVQKFSGTIAGINFETGRATIRRDSFAVLDQAVGVLSEYAEVHIEVQGHTDDVGDDAKNLGLSQARAQAVVDYLVAHGIAADRLTARGFGENKPLLPNDSPANRGKNRRVEFLLVQ